MFIPRTLHNWKISPSKAVAVQRKLASQVIRKGVVQNSRYICGVDATFSRDEKFCLAAIVLWDKKENRVIEEQTGKAKLHFPYIPGLLSFREAPAILTALRKLKNVPDLLLCDGQGIAHQRRLGIASHLGLLTSLPSIGCGKTRLVGKHLDVGLQKGARTPLIDKKEQIGTVLRTRNKVKPLYISIGHKIGLDQAEELVLDCCIKYRLPEPVRLAHQLATSTRKRS